MVRQTRQNSKADSKNRRRSQSATSVPSDNVTPDSDAMVDKGLVESCVNRYLSNQDVLDVLVSKLTEHIKEAVNKALTDTLKKLTEEVDRLRGQVSSLEDQVKYKTDDLEQYHRRNNLRLFGVREKPGEDTDKIIVDLVKNKLGVDLQVDQIERSHRIGAKLKPRDDGREVHRPIIVRFCSYRDRRTVFMAKKSLKATGITIGEDLTKYRLEVLKAAVARFGVRNVWSIDGRVFWLDKGVKHSAMRLESIPTSTVRGP